VHPLHGHPLAEGNAHPLTKEGRKVVALKAGNPGYITEVEATLQMLKHEMPDSLEARVVVEDVSGWRVGRQGPGSLVRRRSDPKR